MTAGEMLQLTNRLKDILNGPTRLIEMRLDSFIEDLTYLMDIDKDPTLNQLYCTVVEERYLERG